MHKAPPAHKQTVNAVKRMWSALLCIHQQCWYFTCSAWFPFVIAQELDGHPNITMGSPLVLQARTCRSRITSQTLQQATWLEQELIQVLY